VLDIVAAVEFYTKRLGFTSRFVEDDFAALVRDDVELHLWAANKPDSAGAEPHIAGTASCRIWVDGIADLFADVQQRGATRQDTEVHRQPWGDREFSVFDADNNVVTFFEPGE
jgi:hypothetical protein